MVHQQHLHWLVTTQNKFKDSIRVSHIINVHSLGIFPLKSDGLI